MVTVNSVICPIGMYFKGIFTKVWKNNTSPCGCETDILNGIITQLGEAANFNCLFKESTFYSICFKYV